MTDAILHGCPKLEIFNSHFTRSFGVWALGFCGNVFGKDNPGCDNQDRPLHTVTSLELSNRSIHNLVNKVQLFAVTIYYCISYHSYLKILVIKYKFDCTFFFSF